VVAVILGVSAYLTAVFMVDRALSGAGKVAFRYFAVAAGVAGFFYGLHRLVDDRARAIDISKAMIAIAAAGCVFYEQHREGLRRPVAERWKRFVGITLALMAISSYFEGFKPGYARFYHRWDQYHYYMGAKYFPEMGYDGLYKCSVAAQDELGTVVYQNEDQIGTGRNRLDMSKEVRHPDKKIRNLGGDNLLIPVTEILEHPEVCKSHFSPERWEEYKGDIRFFRIASDKNYWEDMQKDHGYNPPPVWTILGSYFANFHAASTRYLQFLACLDLFFFAGMFAALWWAWGWRVFAVGAIFWGCQSSAPFLWTGGAFLRQDWLFFFVFAAALTRKRYYTLAGATMVYAALLRVFPGLAVIGWLVVAGAHLVRHRTLSKPQWRMLAGGTLAAALLIPLSIKVAGKDSYREFYRHTLEVHDRTPLTNHMGLRVMVSQKLPFEVGVHQGPIDFEIGTGLKSGRMKYTKDNKLNDPFEVWKRMRNQRYDAWKPVAYGIVALSLLYFVLAVRRVKSLWIAQCLGQIFIILMSQLTCYYYSFMILLAPLTRVKRQLEAPIFGLAALSQFTWIIFGYNDDKYWALTAISLAFLYGVIAIFLSPAARERVSRLLGRHAPVAASAPSGGGDKPSSTEWTE
jgi:hypothetical protein